MSDNLVSTKILSTKNESFYKIAVGAHDFIHFWSKNSHVFVIEIESGVFLSDF